MDSHNIFEHEVDQIVNCLKQGGVVVVPTDTVYGLAVSPHHPSSIERLYAMKRRPRSQPLPVMVASEDDLTSMGVEVTDTAKRLLTSKFVPGALTLAMGFTDSPPSWLAGRKEVAIRIPNDERLLAVLRRTGPLFVTSANAHGISTPETVNDVLPQLDGMPDLVIDGGVLGTVASTLVNCHVSPAKIEREGFISKADLEELGII